MPIDEKNKRSSDLFEGIAQGALKQTVSEAVDPLADALKGIFEEKFGNDNEAMNALADVGSRVLIMLVFAEGLGLLGEQLGGVVDGADEKAELLSRYIRKLAGEEIGEKGVELLFKGLPMVKGMISGFDSIKTEDIKHALGEKSEIYKNVLPEEVPETEADTNSQEEETTIYKALGLSKEK